MLTRLALLAGLAVAPLAALAEGIRVYDAATLAGTDRMAANVTLLLREDIPATLPRALRADAAAIAIHFPDRGPHPISIFADPASNAVILPRETLRFLDDMAILTAWFERHDCERMWTGAYLAGLLQGREAPRPPLAAFGLDRDRVLADPFVDDMSAWILSDAVYFLVAHEVGHLLLGHRAGLTGAASQAQEMAADAFALDRFATIGRPPGGMVATFAWSLWFDVHDPDHSTHPLSGERLQAIADRLAAEPMQFAFSDSDPDRGQRAVMYVAGEIARMAEIARSDGLAALAPMGLAAQFPSSRFATACPG